MKKILLALPFIMVSTASLAQKAHPDCPKVQPYVRCVVSPKNLPPRTPFTSCDYSGGDPGDECICTVRGTDYRGNIQCTVF